jgi:hypothetical protein
MAMALNVLSDGNASGQQVLQYLQSFYQTHGYQLGPYKVGLYDSELAFGTIPPAQADALNDMARGASASNPPWVATYKTGGSTADLIANLKKGVATIVSVAWPSIKVGHALVVIGYDPSTTEFIFLDPYGGDILYERDYKTRFTYDFLQSWQQQPNVFIDRGSMVSVEWKGSSASTSTPTPTRMPLPTYPTGQRRE